MSRQTVPKKTKTKNLTKKKNYASSKATNSKISGEIVNLLQNSFAIIAMNKKALVNYVQIH